jgi:signal transduction histidine kinase
MGRFRPLLEQSKVVITITGLMLIVLLGVLDYMTGPQISFSVFYLLPISLVTWLTNRQGGIFSAIISAITWLIADLTSPTAYSHPLIPLWNAIVRLLVFLTIVFLASALKNLNQDLENRVKDRTALLEEEVAERKKVEERLQQYAKRLEILHEIDQAILAAESFEAVVQATIGHVQNVLPCDRVSFILLDFDTHHIILFEPSGENNSPKPLEKRIPMDKIPDLDAILELLRQDNHKLINDLASSPLNVSIIQILQAEDIRSLLIVPILVQHELIGSLNLMSSLPNAFSPEHQEIPREIANQLGIAINQARMVEKLRTDQENLQALSQRLFEVQETERRNIARELHDEIGQALTSIGLSLEMATQPRTKAPVGNLKQAHILVVDLMERVSQLSLELRPALLDDLGLLPALLWYLDRYSSQTNVKANFKHSGLDKQRLTPEVETAVYRIIQEALTNVARHAHVNKVRVTLWLDQSVLGIQVEDKGSGFEPDAVLAKGSSSGLLGMKERVLLLNGKLIIESAPEMGTRLLAEIPISDQIVPEGRTN